jgi:hypothetical protein
MRGRHISLTLTLPAADQATLEAWQRSTTLSAGLARRGRILLLVAQGHSLTEVAAKVGIARQFITKWVKRYQAYGLDGLRDAPRHGKEAAP